MVLGTTTRTGGLRVALLALALGLGAAGGATVASGPASPRVAEDVAEAPRAAAATIPAAAKEVRGPYAAEVLRILDGDTFDARILVWPGVEVTTRVRLRGIDAPELRARCPEERTRAEAARDALAAILSEGSVAVAAVSLDKYGGRVLAEASTRATPDVAAALMAKGVVRAYDGGRSRTWCGS